MTIDAVGIIPEWTLADRMRKAREVSGLEQGDLADRIGISRTSVSNAERGSVHPRKITVRAWAMATGVPVEWLETGQAPPVEPEGPGGESVRRRGLEPRTRWLFGSGNQTLDRGLMAS